VHRLALLGEQPPGEMLLAAIQFAQEQGYTQADIQRIQDLWNALQATNLAAPRGTP
jgi:hypothetical protein